MVLVGEEGGVSGFESVEVGLVVSVSASRAIAFVLHGSRQRRIRVDGQGEICPEPCTHSLNRFVVHVPDFLLGNVLTLTVLLLLLFLLQEIFLQC